MELHTRTNERHQIWRQVGWLTHVSKTFHPMTTKEPIHDPGGYSPVWEMIENDSIEDRPWDWDGFG